MLGLSNSLRQRLGRAPEPQLHPDADLLTAYVERRLARTEQADMVRHLAACPYCREIVALSLPEAGLQPTAAPSGRFTFRIPMMRWAAVAATLAIGAALVVEEPWKKESALKTESAVNPEGISGSSQAKEISPQAVPAPAGPEVAPAGANPSQPSAQALPAAPALSATRSGLAASSPAAGDARRAFGPERQEPKPSEPVTNQAFADRKRADFNDLAASAPTVNGSVASSAATTSSRPPSPVMTSEAGLVSAPVAKVGQGSETGFVVRKIPITPESIKTNSFAVAFTGQKKETGPSKADATSLRTSRLFSIPGKMLSAGKEKIGAGAIWQSYSMSMVERGPAGGLPAGHLHWSISPEGKLIKSSDLTLWHEAYPQKDDLLFRVVVAEGHDVWAGGSHMTLIHSWNGGVDWKKMKLGDSTSGDITDIHIDGGDVQVKTSNNQTWVSQDGGVTWVPLK